MFLEDVGRMEHVVWKVTQFLFFFIDVLLGFLDSIAKFLVIIPMGDLMLTTT